MNKIYLSRIPDTKQAFNFFNNNQLHNKHNILKY